MPIIQDNQNSADDTRAFGEELQDRYVRIRDGVDRLIWGYSQKETFSIKEAYNIKIRGQTEEDEIWGKVWASNPWSKMATFCWIVVRCIILIGKNLRRRGIQGPSRCVLCANQEESMGHLLDACPFAFDLWDKGAQIFRKGNRSRRNPDQTLRDWNPKDFKNNILRFLWQAFPGTVIWVIWKERNNIIFRGNQHSHEEA